MEKKKRDKREHGAISVFLAMVLVPCIIFTCVFGDLSRVQLSMATAESAGDLALYSLLARYDADLKEYYGLVGSCQDIEQFYEVSATYFTGMMQAEGVSGEGSELFLEYLNQLRSQGYSDFLRCTLSDVSVVAVENSAMGENAALIEDGIVEFMKYRGPIQLTTNLISRFSDLNLEKAVSDVDENKQVTDKKQEYAKTQGELLEQAFYTYLAIRDYEKHQQDGSWKRIPSRQEYGNLSTAMTNIWKDLRAVTSLVTKYYYPGTENLQWKQFPLFSVANYHANESDVGTAVEFPDGTTHYCLGNTELQNLLNGLDEQLEAVKNAGDQFVQACADIPAPATGNNYVVYCMKMQQAIASSSTAISTIQTNGDKLLKTYAKLQAAANCEPYPEGGGGVPLPEDWQQQITAACDKIDEVYRDYLDAGGSSAYMRRVVQYNNIAKTVVSQVKNRGYTFTSAYTGNGAETINGFATAIANNIPEICSHLQEQIARLNVVINGGQIIYNGKPCNVEAIDSLIQKAKDFTDARDDWGAAAGAHDTEYAQQERELYESATRAAESPSEVEDPEVEGERIAAKITPESVDELKKRLVNIRDDMQACLDTLNAFTYGGSKVMDFRDGETIIRAACTVVPQNNSDSLAEAENAAAEYFARLVSPGSEAVYTPPAAVDTADGNGPGLEENTPELYQYLKKQLGQKEIEIETEISKNKERNEGYQKEGEQKKQAAQAVEDQYVANKGSDLADGHQGNPVTALTALSSVATIAKNVVSGSGDELRDQLYVCEYIMSMFSYSDFDNEGKYRLALEQSKKDDSTPPTYKSFPYDDQKAAWEQEDSTKVYRNQSLTNRPIVKANNHANLGEVEYILYGNASIDENLKKAYANIFAIRETMNVVSGFCNFYDSTKNNTAKVIGHIATTVASATSGIVPVPVTKCVLIVALATLESAKDLERLKAGARVELYKSSADNWVYKISSSSSDSGSASMGAEEEDQAESGLYYSDYMYIFLLLGLTSDTTYPSMLLRVGDLIEANMRLTEGNETFDLEKTRCYFKITGKVRVNPLMLTLPIVDSMEGVDVGTLREKTDWCTYELGIIRGYS